jgi:hypothetical protein
MRQKKRAFGSECSTAARQATDTATLWRAPSMSSGRSDGSSREIRALHRESASAAHRGCSRVTEL